MSDNEERWDSLPDEILTHIFLSLPIKSIIICTSVSKTWNSLIQNSTFISTHLHHSYTNNNHNLLLFKLVTQPVNPQSTDNNKEVYLLYKEDDDDGFTEELTRFEPNNHIFHVVGTCNGVLCLSNDIFNFNTDRFLLWNPCVRKFLQLPHSNIRCATHTNADFYASIGFGFDATTNDYKVVRLLTFACTSRRTEVEIYSLSTSEWRMLSSGLALQCALGPRPRQPRAFLNGALHWVAFRAISVNKTHHFVLVFDLGDEVFREILLPEELPPYTHDGFLCAYVSIHGNSIALFHYDYSSLRLNIWVMKHYGVVSSWTKALSLPVTYQGGFASTNYIPKAVGFTRNGRIVLEMNGGHLMSQDLKSQEIKDLRLIGYNYNFVDAYVKSLVLLDKAANGAMTY